MKKVLSLLMCALFLLSALTVCVNAASKTALPTSAGLSALRGQFSSGTAPKTEGFTLDYKYYSPVGNGDNNKYPIVIFLHGIGHGEYAGSQLADSGMAYWASSELQSRFINGGAFILLPRCPENLNIFWGDSLIEPLHALIDDFIKQHKNNVDTTRIAISGSSQGGAMVWNMVDAYPEYFSAAFPIASTESPSANVLKRASGTAVWLIASSKDPVINYTAITKPLWNRVCENNAHPENCRLSTLGTVYNPDGSKSSDNHHLAGVITYDLHTLQNGKYPDMTTVDGTGRTVDLASPNGLIKWISSVQSGFTGDNGSSGSNVNILKRIIDVFRNLLLEIVHIVQMILGL